MIGVQALAISIEMVLIPAAGLWLDSKLGTGVLFGGIGLVLGMFVGIKQLIRLGETETKNIKNEEEESENDSSSGEQNGA